MGNETVGKVTGWMRRIIHMVAKLYVATDSG